ncbi:PIR protein, putative [Plasmodium sp.]|nr:PIR protein, putative [Plasmodium sp.]
MKVHYINILLFALPLYILDHNQRNHNSTTYHASKTKSIKTHRSLCECELYAPSDYDNDPEMKEVMEIFNRQTSKRFREYEERMEDKRKQYKEQYDKETQQIILKEKIQNVLTEKLEALETNIDANEIPTCVCEKSLADEVQKFCLKCGYRLGGALTSCEILGYTGIYSWEVVATSLAKEEAIKSGINAVLEYLSTFPGLNRLPGFNIAGMINSTNFNKSMSIMEILQGINNAACDNIGSSSTKSTFCAFLKQDGVKKLAGCAREAAQVGISETASVQGSKLASIKNTMLSSNTILIASAITILAIVLVMLIIYLILRYRRKKKMKKKLQYIKLLK